MIEGMVSRGYARDFAKRCFRQIEGFGEYGFPESHAASFALLVYASCWFKTFYPDVFCAAILNAQPMGFYAPAQLVRDARDHGLEVRAVDVNFSDWDCTLEPAAFDAGRVAARHASMRGVIRSRHAVRLGFRQVKGLSRPDMEQLVAHRGRGYDSVRDLWLRSGLPAAVVERLAAADAFRSLGIDRRQAMWSVRALDPHGAAERLPLFERPALALRDLEPEAKLPAMPLGEHVLHDYRTLFLSLKAHPVSFLRERLAADGTLRAQALGETASGRRVEVAGLVLVRQRPGSAKGVIFMTLEDETGVANVIVWPKVFDRFRPLVLGARFVRIRGKLQAQHGVVHVIADSVEDLTPWLAVLSEATCDPGLARLASPGPAGQAAPSGQRRGAPSFSGRDAGMLARKVHAAMPKGRNFQ
jgi:error-prone DNA polymerase